MICSVSYKMHVHTGPLQVEYAVYSYRGVVQGLLYLYALSQLQEFNRPINSLRIHTCTGRFLVFLWVQCTNSSLYLYKYTVQGACTGSL
jgi:hypothetical protein